MPIVKRKHKPGAAPGRNKRHTPKRKTAAALGLGAPWKPDEEVPQDARPRKRGNEKSTGKPFGRGEFWKGNPGGKPSLVWYREWMEEPRYRSTSTGELIASIEVLLFSAMKIASNPMHEDCLNAIKFLFAYYAGQAPAASTLEVRHTSPDGSMSPVGANETFEVVIVSPNGSRKTLPPIRKLDSVRADIPVDGSNPEGVEPVPDDPDVSSKP
jgi:hypothetical protein